MRSNLLTKYALVLCIDLRTIWIWEFCSLHLSYKSIHHEGPLFTAVVPVSVDEEGTLGRQAISSAGKPCLGGKKNEEIKNITT